MYVKNPATGERFKVNFVIVEKDLSALFSSNAGSESNESDHSEAIIVPEDEQTDWINQISAAEKKSLAFASA